MVGLHELHSSVRVGDAKT